MGGQSSKQQKKISYDNKCGFFFDKKQEIYICKNGNKYKKRKRIMPNSFDRSKELIPKYRFELKLDAIEGVKHIIKDSNYIDDFNNWDCVRWPIIFMSPLEKNADHPNDNYIQRLRNLLNSKYDQIFKAFIIRINSINTNNIKKEKKQALAIELDNEKEKKQALAIELDNEIKKKIENDKKNIKDIIINADNWGMHDNNNKNYLPFN